MNRTRGVNGPNAAALHYGLRVLVLDVRAGEARKAERLATRLAEYRDLAPEQLDFTGRVVRAALGERLDWTIEQLQGGSEPTAAADVALITALQDLDRYLYWNRPSIVPDRPVV